MLRRPFESAQYTSEQLQKLMADHDVVCSMSRSGNVWDNAAMESVFSSLKTERTAHKTYRTRDDARADVFDYIERFYNAKRRHSTIGYRSPMEFEMKAVGSALTFVPARPTITAAQIEAIRFMILSSFVKPGLLISNALQSISSWRNDTPDSPDLSCGSRTLLRIRALSPR